MKRIQVVLLALVALAFCVWPAAFAIAGETSEASPNFISAAIEAVFRHLDTAIIFLGVASFALNQLSQIWAWSKESKMGAIERLIEAAISGAYLLKGQAIKKDGGKLTLEQGREMADTALDILKSSAAQEGINLDAELGDDLVKRGVIQSVFDRMRSIAKRNGREPDALASVAANPAA